MSNRDFSHGIGAIDRSPVKSWRSFISRMRSALTTIFGGNERRRLVSQAKQTLSVGLHCMRFGAALL